MQKIDLFDNKFDIGYAQNIFEVSRRFPEKTVDIFDEKGLPLPLADVANCYNFNSLANLFLVWLQHFT